MEISTFSGLLKCKERSGEIFFSPGCSTEAVDCRLCTRLVCGIHIDVKGSSSRRTKVECASGNGAGRRRKKRGLLLFDRWRINTVSIAVRRMVWHKWFSCWFLSHPKETIEKTPKMHSIKILGKSFHAPVRYRGAPRTEHSFLCCLYGFGSPEHSKSNSQYLQAVTGLP